jgi:hypothetical protein
MSTLLELQRAVRSALLSATNAAAPPGILASGIDPAARLDIYRGNVIGNLTGALKLTFPAVERLVGADFFYATTMRFLVARPPTKPNLYEWGGELPDFLASFPPAASLPYLPDVARLEWAVGRALHAPTVAPLDPRVLTELTAEDQAGVRFRTHPSVSLLALSHPAHRIWQAVLSGDDAALGDIDPGSGGEWLIIYRAGNQIDVMHLSAAGLRFADALCNGIALPEALAVIENENAIGLLAGFLAHGLFSEAIMPSIPIVDGG